MNAKQSTMNAMKKPTRAELDEAGYQASQRAALLKRVEKLEAGLRQVIACLQQPVQFSGLREPSTADILRGDCAVAVKMAQRTLGHKA